jgi:hypothetical protein
MFIFHHAGVEISYFVQFLYIILPVLQRRRRRKEPHNLVGAGAVTGCGSGFGSDVSGLTNGIKRGKQLKKDTKWNNL